LIKRAIDEKINTKKYYNYSGRNYYCGDEEVTNNGFEYYLVNLDPSNPISEPIKLSIQSSSESKDYIADFNGDGKADVLIINSDKTYKIVSFKQLKVAPWVEIEILTKDIFVPGIFAEYDKDKQLVFGDFNGDSKTDIMIPEANDSSNWFLYQATGTGFEKIAYPNFEWYEPQGDKGPASKHRLKFRNYRSADLDKDGKSDFVVSEYETWCVADIVSNWEKCNRNGIGYLHLKRNTGSIDTKPVFSERITTSVSTSGADYDKSPPIQLLIGDYKNHQANFNFAFIQGTQIWKGNFNKDLSRDATLVKVTEAAGAITQTLSYKPLVPSSGLETANDVYYSSHRNNSPTPLESYPYTELIKAPTMNVVDKITVTGAGQTKSQLFKYFGLVTHAQGYGVLGFRKMARSSWYTDANPNKIWSCSQMNPLLLGQKIFEWSYSGDNHLANFRSFSIDDTESTVLGTTKNTYTTSFLANGVKNIVPFTSEKKDFLTGLTDKTEFFYDSYWNISRMLATNAVGTKENRNLVYDNPDGVGKLYALGRIVQTNQTLSAYGDTFTTEEKFTYHPTATNLVQQSHKKGHNTDYISTNYVYDVFGNLTEKTISAPALTSLTIKDKYDNNGRFVLQKTDHELFVTKFTYNKLGQVLTSTSPLAVKNTTTYDKWGKITTNVITGGSDAALTTTTTYSRFADGGFSVTSTKSNTNEVSRSFQDVFGRTTKSTTKGFAVDSWISKSTEYDFLGRKTSESEPYFDSNPTTAIGSGTKWNTVDYDYLSRPESQTSYNGRTQTILYDGLSTTTIDGPKTMKVTVDANGNKTQLLDNSETLSYTYYANGTPKQTLYGNHSIDTQFDGWGRKIYMLDPSVSTTPYTYTYTDFGEILTETTPTGVTTFNYSPTGRLTKKTSIGQNTNTETNYTYNTKGILVHEIGKSNGKDFRTTYQFDAYNRLIANYEITPDNINHQKGFTYDGYGRLHTETYNSYLANNVYVNSGRTIVYRYNTYNGMLEQYDNAVPGVASTLLWKLNDANEKMQVLSASLGNGMQITNTYDANDYVKTINHSDGTNTALNLEYQFKGDRGTLDYRKNTIPGVLSWDETFTYDSFERLESWTDPTGTAANSYETDGRIKTND
jgi:YD repeat-containing protein